MYSRASLENWTRCHNFLVFIVMCKMDGRMQKFIYLKFMSTFYMLNSVLITSHKHVGIKRTYLPLSKLQCISGEETSYYINKCHFSYGGSTDSSFLSLGHSSA